MAISRYDRKLNHIKSAKVRVSRVVPHGKEGSDGEMVLVVNYSGMRLYIKHGSHWFLIVDQLKRDFQGSTYNSDERASLSVSNSHSKINSKGALEANQDILLSSPLDASPAGSTYSIRPKSGHNKDSYIHLHMLYTGTESELLRLKNGHMQMARDDNGSTDNIFFQITNIRDSAGRNDGSLEINSVNGNTFISMYDSSPTDGWVIGKDHNATAADAELYIGKGGYAPDRAIIGCKADGRFAKFSSRGSQLTLQSKTGASKLHFVNDKGSAGADGDDVGTILFTSDNTAEEQTDFAKIVAEVSESLDGDEAGKLSLFVAESNDSVSQLTAGLVLEGEHATDGEVDVTIGAGAASMTTIAGDLSVAGNDIAFPGNGTIYATGHCSINVGATKDIFLTENSGTYTPSAANHATPKHYVDAMVYPGQILGYTYNHPSSLIYHLLTTSMTVEANTHFVTFDTPPSEKVEITVSAFFDRSSTSDVGVYMGLSLNATYSQLGDEWAYDFSSGIGNSDDEADDRYENVKFVLQAAELEAVGVSNTVYIGLASTDSSAVYLRYGTSGGRTYPPMIIKAVALPSSINEE